MRRWLNARDRTCRNPICQRPAWLCDQDHTLAYHKGGQTCSCNLGPPCRRHHKLKQTPGWRLEQPEPGVFRWIAPSGRTYTTAPTAYDP